MMRLTTTLAAALLVTTPLAAATIDVFVASPALTPADAAAVKSNCDAYLAYAAALQTRFEAGKGPATVATTLRDYDNLTRVLESVAFDAGLVGQTAVTAEVRDAARACEGAAGNRISAVGLSRPVYDRLKAIAPPADPVAARILTRTLAAYERAGVAGDPATLKRILALQEKITADGIAFDANIANGRKTITATPAELAGLPADYLAARKPGPDGLVTISTDTPDRAPVANYALSSDLRRRMALAAGTRAPANDAVLASLLTTRQTLATLLGRPDYATLILEDKMAGSSARVRAFLDELAGIADAPATRDAKRMLARLQKVDPALTSIPPWSTSFAETLIKTEDYAVDPQEVRKYFAYDKIEAGILQLTQDLFGVTIRPWQTKVWHSSVKAFEVVEKGAVIGRFYLDMHPREGKYGHANVVPIRFGLKGRALPVAALVMNASDGLMEHRDVETFLHEFGHMLHVMFSGDQAWDLASMSNVEWDFIEAPSQMLEEWVWDYDTLKHFAVDARGRTIPRDLVDKMNRARRFAVAFWDRRDLGLANVSLSYHSGAAPADLTAAYRAAYDAYGSPPAMDGVSPQNSFGHLNGYSAIYYTYAWSRVISEDLLTGFGANGLRDPATARRYRELVLARGGSKPAATLIEDFLGRPLSIDAYRASLAP